VPLTHYAMQVFVSSDRTLTYPWSSEKCCEPT